MRRTTTSRLLTAAATAGAASLTLASGASAVTSGVSGAIVNRAQGTCLDPTVAPNPYDTLAGAPCSGSAAQRFTFTPLTSGQPAHTFQIKDTGTGQCIVQFRFGIRHGACAGGWTLQRLGTAARRYRIVEPASVGGAVQGCWQVDPQASGQPGPLFTIAQCDGSAGQTFTLPAGL